MSVRKRPISLGMQLLLFSVTRLILTTGFRMIYPFLPVFARGLGVSLAAVAFGVTLRSLLGLAAPLFSALPESRGKRIGTVVGFVFFVVGMFVVPLNPIYLVFLASLMLVMIAKIVVDPSVQGYVADNVDFSKRGRAIAITEFSWSGAFLIGVPLVGLLIAYAGWIAPFPVLGALGLLSTIALWVLIPSDRPTKTLNRVQGSMFLAILKDRPALAALGVTFLIGTANELVAIVFGAWLEVSFGLQVVALGAASAVIGLAEFGGESFVAVISDHIGLRLSVALGITGSILAGLSLPFLGGSLAGALLGLFLLFLTFEATVIASIPLITELFPRGKATLLSGNIAAFSAGRAVGALLGPIIFSFGLIGNGAASAILNLIALFVLWKFVRLTPTSK